MKNYRWVSLLASMLVLIVIAVVSCRDSETNVDAEKFVPSYLNLGDSATFVGMDVCAQCHGNKHETFLHTGMGLSFGAATKSKSSALISTHDAVYDSAMDFWYKPMWINDSLFIKEFRLDGHDTLHSRIQRIDYVVGSGQHTNSHLFLSRGFLFQAPLTWYAQKKCWDLPPGFEMGSSSRFSRKIGLECMTCHNSIPGFEQGSENRFTYIPGGISCERCHGPGSIHVRQKKAGIIVDTSKAIDYSIVNPRKLPSDLQMDICQRCHLQGNAVVKPGKSFLDFKPGMRLSDVMTVFLPRYSDSDDEFIMASHADRLKMSACFIKSDGKLTCISCHNPHVSVKITGTQIFNQSCNNCHKSGGANVLCSESKIKREKQGNNCVSCHMPPSGSVDIPHVSIHDHYIRRPVTKEKAGKIREFLGLVAVNNATPDTRTRMEAYLNQFEKFDNKPYLLDSALQYFQAMGATALSDNLDLSVRYFFLKRDYTGLRNLVQKAGAEVLLTRRLIRKMPDNADAWTAYRIGEAFENSGNQTGALQFFEAACRLAPLIPEFQNKKGSCLVALTRKKEALKIFEGLVNSHPYFAPGFSNLGYLKSEQGDRAGALELYNKALSLDPDYEMAVMNKVALLVSLNQYDKALQVIGPFAKRFPKNDRAREVLAYLRKS